MNLIVIFVTFLSLPSISFADIMVLNLNGNSSTVYAAKKAGKKRGEGVIELPKKGEFLNKKNLDKYLTEIQKDGKNITSIVISGHDGGGFFSGTTGSLNKVEIKELLSNYPKISNNVKSLVLRGCYTATFNEAVSHTPLTKEHHWQTIFPNLNILSGYVAGAPSSEKKESKSFIEEILTLEEELYLAESIEDMQKLFLDISNSKYTTHAVAVRPCSNKNKMIYGNLNLIRKGIHFSSPEEIAKLCNPSLLESHEDVLEEYYFAYIEGKKSPPKDHHNSKLRDSYTYIHENAHCKALEADDGEIDLQQAIRLIYFDYIVSNFKLHNKVFLNDLKKLIDWYNQKADKKIKIPDFQEVSRREIINFVHKLYEISLVDYETVNATPTFALKNIDNPKISLLQKSATYLNNMLFKLDPELVPFDWVSSRKSQVPPPYPVSLDQDSVTAANTAILNEEAAVLSGLSVNGKLELYFKKNKNEYPKLESLLVKDLMYNVFKEVPTGIANMASQVMVSVSENRRASMPVFLSLSTEPEEAITFHKRIKAFIQNSKEAYPYESLFIAMKYRYFFSEKELENLFSIMKQSSKFKEQKTKDLILDYLNSNSIWDDMAGSHLPPALLRDLFEKEIPEIKPTLRTLREELIRDYREMYPEIVMNQDELDRLP